MGVHLSREGQIVYAGAHVDTSADRIALCAETVAISGVDNDDVPLFHRLIGKIQCCCQRCNVGNVLSVRKSGKVYGEPYY